MFTVNFITNYYFIKKHFQSIRSEYVLRSSSDMSISLNVSFSCKDLCNKTFLFIPFTKRVFAGLIFKKFPSLKSIFFLTIFPFFTMFAQSGSEALSNFLTAMNSLESIRANINFNGMTGIMSYKKPNSLYVKFSDGRVISANGRYLWFYNPARTIAGKQDLTGVTGGLYGLLSGYESVSVSGSTLRLFSETKAYEEIIIQMTPNYLLKSIRMKPRGSARMIEISLSNVQTNIGLPASLFNYHPPSTAQIVENPLNQRE